MNRALPPMPTAGPTKEGLLASQPPDLSAPERPRSPMRWALGPTVVLLVEDNMVSNIAMTRLLQSLGIGTVLSSFGLRL